MICEHYHRPRPGANGKDAGDPFVLGFDAIGTRWEIETREPLGEPLKRRMFERIEEFDAAYSRFRPDSLVSRIADAPDGGRFDFPDDSVVLFDLYGRLHAATGGAVDPLVGRDLELLGYDRTYSFTPASVPVRAAEHARGRAAWSEDVVRDGTSLVTRRPLVIDVGAAGKGYLVDIVAEILRESGFTRFVVDGGGDIRHTGEGSMRIGLEHPFDPRLVIGTADLRDRALCASAVNRRAWGEGLHHELDARTGVPARDVVATWVVADDAATADGALLRGGGRSGGGLPLLVRADVRRRPRRDLTQLRRRALRVRTRPAAERIPVDATDRMPPEQADQPARKGEGMTTRSNRMKIAMAGISAALVLAGCSTTDTEAPRSPSGPDAGATRSGPASSRDLAYADGSYTATGEYGSLPSSIGVSVTLDDEVVTAVEVTPNATNPTSRDYQERFAEAVPERVVGRPIDEVRVDRLAGSSGTPDGFNAAIERIRERASA